MMKNGRMWKYTPAKTREAEAKVREQILDQLPKKFTPLKAPLSVTLKIQRARPKSRKKQAYPDTRPDLDNYAKLYLDAMNGLVFEDDSQIVALIATKNYSNGIETTGALITINELKEEIQ